MHAKRKWRVENPDKSAYAVLRSHAKERGHTFTVSYTEFLDVIKATGYLDSKGVFAHNLQIDRKDATQGYIAGNLQVITCSENSGKERRSKFLVGRKPHNSTVYVPEENEWTTL